MPTKPAKKSEDEEFEESLKKMVKVGTAILSVPKDASKKPVLHRKNPPEEITPKIVEKEKKKPRRVKK